MKVSSYAGLGLLVALAACGAETVDIAGDSRAERIPLAEISPDVDFTAAPKDLTPFIVNGQQDFGDPAVALLVGVDANGGTVFTCSATLIAPTRLLTAAHCIDGTTPVAGFSAYFGGQFPGNDPDFIFQTSAESVIVHPQWNPNADLNNGNDIGLVVLREAVPIQPIPFRTAALTPGDVGSQVTLVGWGITGGGLGDSGLKRFVDSTLHDFDDLLVVVGDENVGTCSGDSGGPAFATNAAGNEEIIGVTSFGDANCEQISVDTRVDSFKRFIASDGAELDNPGGGLGAAGFGDACVEGEDCASGICVTNPGGGFCSELCDPLAVIDSCPSAAFCEDFDGTGACVPGDDDDDDNGGAFPPVRRDEGGCAAGGTGGSSALILIALVGLIRRRRRI